MKITCRTCPHLCSIDEHKVGLCKARSNQEGKIIPINYGLLTSIALDPIEKKPLMRFHPGSKILSVGSFGCNLKCQFCQNHEISMASKEKANARYVPPEDLVMAAVDLVSRNNIGIAYTYNEPLVGYEYVRDCAKLAREKGLKNVVVTNGCFLKEPMNEIMPLIDAFNIDLKGFTNEFYKKIGGDLEIVKNFIALAAESSHVEVTTLIIPDENDSEEEIENLSKFIAGIDVNMPLHISRFFPCYKMQDKNPTEVEKVYKLADIARKNLNYVYEGNC
ncbi:AmmeMemoRadiSam system radical SAM enzyme [Sedimentibacter saalensis]|uniref:AmmeMemoRadiSam system radical SAM enzyme n=1 Tax=Sedimentibacter saalensis TaxID=130788 RepID=UPI002896DD93|nr:AmmeMemoRadiSam system radical SAM enzyme [Sedimentibacter saalensis]MEA5093413.1 AmmeMemoRadiSam system radical SAM enzyme [Sedimentibacter saalensis]